MELSNLGYSGRVGVTRKNEGQHTKTTQIFQRSNLIPGEEMNKKEEIVISIPLGLALSDVYRVMII